MFRGMGVPPIPKTCRKFRRENCRSKGWRCDGRDERPVDANVRLIQVDLLDEGVGIVPIPFLIRFRQDGRLWNKQRDGLRSLLVNHGVRDVGAVT